MKNSNQYQRKRCIHQRWGVVLMWMMLWLATPLSASIHYVMPVANGAGDGSSWTNASNDLQAIINASNPGDEIWVAAGTYWPTATNDRTVCFSMRNGIAIYGGFTGDELTRTERDFVVNITILSGDIGSTGDNSDNSYHVINNAYLDYTAVLDGFTITGGNATDIETNGGGIYNFYSSPTISNCMFYSNTASVDGGGMFNILYSSPVLTNCIFSENTAYYNGGGMSNYISSSPSLNNCTFISNATDYFSYGGGGGIYNLESSPEVFNCAFSNNSGSGGGGIMNNMSSPAISNSTFSNNVAMSGGGIFNHNSSAPNVTNCVFSGNNGGGGGMCNSQSSPTVTNCTFKDNFSGFFGGGGMNNFSSYAVITNCIFLNNFSSYQGGSGMYNESSAPIIINCSFSGNKTDYMTGGLLNIQSNPVITNCILWGNMDEIINDNSDPIVTYSIVQNGYPGDGNLDVDPVFVSSTDLHLKGCSPAIDAATDAGSPTNDYDGNPRPFDADPSLPGNYDMGAYEKQTVNPPAGAVCVDITVELNEFGNATIVGSDVNENACGILNLSEVNFYCSNLGSNTITLTVTDEEGNNTSSCNAAVTVIDKIAPSIFCKEITVSPNAEGTYVIDPAALLEYSYDNCEVALLSATPSTIPCFHTYYIEEVIITVTDGSGNSTSCSGIVTLLGDSDCDGVGDACDVCPGGNDQIDRNFDGQPDCHVYPGFNNLSRRWKCSENVNSQKVFICHNDSILCVSVSAIAGHLNHGDYIGPCGSSSCDSYPKYAKTDSEDLNLFEEGRNDYFSEESGFVIYPNPTDSRLYFVALEDYNGDYASLAIYSAVGTLIQSRPLNTTAGEMLELNLNDVSPGTYFLTVRKEGQQTRTVRFIVQRN